jgi:ABC-2 type transport system permease protein
MKKMLRIVEKELYVYFKTYYTELSYVILFPIFLIVSMQLGIGDKVSIGNVDYIEFISPGILMMAAVTTAFFNTGFIMLFEKEYSESFTGLITCPVSSNDIAMAKILSGTIKSTINGIVILVIIIALIDYIPPWTIWLSPIILFVSSLVFSAMGLMLGVFLKKGYQLGTIGNLVILPLTFIGGMFFDVRDLPGWMASAAQASPVTMMIDGLRKVMIYGDPWIAFECVVILITFVIFFVASVKVFEKTVIH